MESGGGVQNLLGDLSLIKTVEPSTEFLDFWKILSYHLNQALWRAASEGPVEAVASASLASNSFCTLEGVAPSLELLVVALLLHFRSLRGSLTLRLQRGHSFSGVGSSALSESMLEASLICSWTCWQGCDILGADSFGSDTSISSPPSSG